MLVPGKKYAAFSIREGKSGGSVWVRAGSAWVNKDGSMNVYLDVLPIDGRLHVREAGDRKEAAVAIAPQRLESEQIGQNGVEATAVAGGQL